MNYSRNMRVNVKRLITTWIITMIIAASLSAIITVFILRDEAEAQETAYFFFTEEVQEPEQRTTQIPTITPTEPVIDESAMESLGEYIITAYCPCEVCCGAWAIDRPDGIVYGAAGIELQEGVSIASTLPFGTEVFIDGLGEYVVEDRPASWIADKYDDKIIDIYFETHEDAVNFGKQNKEILIKGD